MKENVYINQERRDALRREWERKDEEKPPVRKMSREKVWKLLLEDVSSAPCPNILKVEQKSEDEEGKPPPKRIRSREQVFKLVTEEL